MLHRVSFEGVVTEEDRRRGVYLYLPFEVPARTRRIEVAYGYDRPRGSPAATRGGNVLDIGVFDPRGTDFLAAGFRGWSGGSRFAFFISATEATPGYLAGPLMAGRWSIILGVAKLFEPPCGYRVSIEMDVALRDERVEEAPAPLERPTPAPIAGGADGPGRWYRGDLHCHTVHSDGLNSIPEVAAFAKRRGLDFLAITDHNTASHHAEIDSLPDQGLLLIPGEEVTTYDGHANVWGLREWIDFRCEDAETVRRLARFVEGRGALFSVNHPKPTGDPWNFGYVPEARAMEVWQAPWRYYNWRSVALWEEWLAKGKAVVAVGGSDTHSVPPAAPSHPHGPGEPCTWAFVRGPLTEAGVLDAIARGHVVISEDPTGPLLTLAAAANGDALHDAIAGDTVEAPEGSEVRVRVDYRGLPGKTVRLLHGTDVIEEFEVMSEASREFTLRLEEPGYVRAEAAGRRGVSDPRPVVHAMTNPLYLRPKER